MKNRFIIIGPGERNNILNHSFVEVIQGEIENASFLNPYNFKSKFIEKIYNYVYRLSNRRFFKWIPNSIWNHFSVLNQISPEPNEKIYLIFVIGRDVDRLIVPSLLRGMKKKFGHSICTALLLFDSIDVTKDVKGWGKIKNTFTLFDIVATFDKKDACTYNLMHFYDPYPKMQMTDTLEIDEDMFFIGVDKGRCEMLKQIAVRANFAGIRCDFEIFGLNPEYESIPGLVRLEKFLEYSETLKKVARCKCLVELLAEGQTSCSYRYYEAVVYNKKLITNNKNITEMPIYDPKYMKYIESVDDIDWEWIKDESAVEYNYDNEFSISELFKKLLDYNQGGI